MYASYQMHSDMMGPMRAVAASSAVPGLFAPQRLGDRRAMDGGVSGSGIHADLVAAPEAVEVVEDAPEDPALQVGGGRSRQVDLADALVPDAVHPLVLEGHPPDLALGVGQLEAGEPLERAAVDPVADRALGVVGVERHRHRERGIG